MNHRRAVHRGIIVIQDQASKSQIHNAQGYFAQGKKVKARPV